MAETCQKESGQAGLSVKTTYSASPNTIKAGGTETQAKSQKEHPFCPRRFVLEDLSIKVFTIGFPFLTYVSPVTYVKMVKICYQKGVFYGSSKQEARGTSAPGF